MLARRSREAATALILIWATACSLIIDTSDFAGEPLLEVSDATGIIDVTAEVAARDAPPDLDAGERDEHPPEAGPELALNGDFELGCAGWSTLRSVLTDSSLARGGTKACMLCTAGGGSGSSSLLYQDIPYDGSADSVFLVEGWVRAAPDAGAVSPTGIFVRLSGGSPATVSAVGSVAPDMQWRRVSSLARAGAGGVRNLEVNVGRPAAGAIDAGLCVLVDDVSIRRLE